jgi:BirA family biotin operon repressor/biotin-[acetyl-CoA-carboxylase] ligase
MRNMTIPLVASRIKALTASARLPSAIDVAVEVVQETGSTNADLLARLDDLTSATLLAAEMQTAGRGRAGRAWRSNPAQALTFSLAWKFGVPLPSLVGLPLAVGVILADVLAGFGVDTRLKWPNDVLKEGNKLAGILIETASSATLAAHEIWAVIGIGVNMTVTDQLTTDIGKAVADMPDLDRNLLLASLLTALTAGLMNFEQYGFKMFMARWNALDAYAGEAVRILDRGQLLHEGRAIGVDATGRLLLETVNGRIAVMAGDVSLRKQDN